MEARERSGAMPEAVLRPAVMERVLVLEEERWWRRWEGVGCEGPERRWFVAEWSEGSGKPAEVEEVLDTTDAFWAARSMESSLVNRLTCSN
jgi:hypothetical protein